MKRNRENAEWSIQSLWDWVSVASKIKFKTFIRPAQIKFIIYIKAVWEEGVAPFLVFFSPAFGLQGGKSCILLFCLFVPGKLSKN